MHVVTYDREFRKLNQAKTRNFKINVIKVLKTAESVAIDSIHLKACLGLGIIRHGFKS